MNKTKLLSLAGGLLFTGAIARQVINQPVPSHFLEGIDPSVSIRPNCPGVRATSKALLKGLPGIREGSTFTLLIMGTDRQNPDPALAFTGPIPIEPDTVFGNDPEAFRQTESAFFDEAEKACLAAKPGQNSPIYALVKNGLAHLHNDALRCGPNGHCRFLLKTDLEEDLHEALRTLIRQSVKNPDVPVTAELIGSLDNTGIEVTFCGVSEVKPKPRGGEAPSTTEARIRIWRALFTHPELTSFRLYCN